jgi:hypothetical protein
VVLDVTTGAEAARVPVDGLADWGGWEAPPVVLVGDTVYVKDSKHVLLVDWRTGHVETERKTGPFVSTITGGRTLELDRKPAETKDPYDLRIVDVATGDTVLSLTGPGAPWAVLSPDGSHAIVNDQMDMTGGTFQVYDVDSGSHVTMRGDTWEFGWTSRSDLYSVDSRGVHLCDADTGGCTTTQLPASVHLDGSVLLGGLGQYES